MYGSVNIPGGNFKSSVPGRVENSLKPKPSASTKQRPPEMDLPRALNYYADYSGCGHWRMIWPEQLLNAYHKCIVHGSSCMVLDERYYTGVKAVRIQRQATAEQMKFVKFLTDLGKKRGFPVLYEIDDICLREDIPDYNKFKFAFDNDKIRSTIIEMMNMTDEMTVTCQFMKDYYTEKTGHKQITVVPNYLPKFWIGNHYNPKHIENNYRKNVRKPRVLYAGSGAHFDVANKTNQVDDFHHVLQAIRSTIDDFQWVFLGAAPQLLKNYIQAGKIEFHQWSPLYEYPAQLQKLGVNCLVAPLSDNNFNRAKSNLKLIEACALGLPIACQDMCTYEDAKFKFKTGDEMIDQIKVMTSGISSYMGYSRQARDFAEGLWLEDHVDVYRELYTHPYGDPGRVKLNKINGI